MIFYTLSSQNTSNTVSNYIDGKHPGLQIKPEITFIKTKMDHNLVVSKTLIGLKYGWLQKLRRSKTKVASTTALDKNYGGFHHYVMFFLSHNFE